jgi:hypothetical protein
MSNFRLGDRVEIIKAYDKDFGAVGQIGTVVGLNDGSIEVSGVGYPVTNGGGWFHAPESLRLAGPTYTRDDLIRVVLGQQWAVAIALAYQAGVMVMVVPDEEAAAVGDLPCAVDVVDGIG